MYCDEFYMQLAIQEAELAFEQGEVPIGAVLVNEDGVIVSKTHNLVETLNDPTAHAEMLAVKDAVKIFGRSLTNLTIYVTMEPCPMCAGALVLSKIKRLVYAVPDSKAGASESLFNITSNYHLNHRLEVTAGVLENRARELLKSFFKIRRDINHGRKQT